MRRLRLFISHPSHFLTDCEPHGDGLLAQEFIRRLGEREHELHVAVPVMKLARPFPPSVHLHPVASWTAVSTANPSAPNRLEYAIRVRRLFQQLHPAVGFDAIHQLNPVVLGMSALLNGLGVPVVLGPLPAPGSLPLPQSFGRRVNRAVLHAQLRRAAMVLLPSQASLPLLPTDADAQAKARLVPFGVDTTAFAPCPEMHDLPEPATPNVLFLANLVPKKGALVLLEAFEQIADRYPGWRLRFAGDGEQRASLEQRAAQSPVGQRIDFLGRVPREQVAAVLRSATVYVLPSASEAFGMTALEAMACGRPVIATDVGGLGQLVRETSPRVPVNDRQALCAALDTFLSSATLRTEAGRRNRQVAVEQYEWSRVIDRLEAAYAGLLHL